MLDGRAREYINAIRRLGGVYFRNTKSRCPFFILLIKRLVESARGALTPMELAGTAGHHRRNLYL